MTNEYNSEGRLPIHEAAFHDYDMIVERILTEISSKHGHQNNENEEARNEEENQRHDLLHQEHVQEMLEAITYDYFRLTPLLAATIGNARRTIECLIKHGAKVTCRDGDGRSMAAITILKQNADLFLYFSEAPYANELDLWNTLMTMFTSKTYEDSVAAAFMLEQLTSRPYISTVWPNLSNLRVMEKNIQVLVSTVNNTTNPNEPLLISCLTILYNIMHADPATKTAFSQNEDGARALVKMQKVNETVQLLFADITCRLCDDVRSIQILVDQSLIGEIQRLLDADTMNIPKRLICLYFEILGKVAYCKKEYQTLIQKSSTATRTILEQAVDLLYRFDRELTLSILHFVRGLCLENEQQQKICADHHLLIAHLLSALNSSYKDVQRASVDTLQMIITHNTSSQAILLQQGGAEQLLTLLYKATLPKLRVSIICTLWSLTGDDPSRRQSMAYSIGPSILVDVLNSKSSEQLYVLLDALSELFRRVPTAKENFPLECGRRHCIPPMVRLLTPDREQKLLLRCLHCIQQLCLLPTYNSCRENQTIFEKANGFREVMAIIRRSNKDRRLQVKAILTIATAIFDHKENKDILAKAGGYPLLKRISLLLNSNNEDVQAEAGLGLVTFICNDVNYYDYSLENMELNHKRFCRLLKSTNISNRCNAAFQMIILIRHFHDVNSSEWIGQALMSLLKTISDSRINDQEKVLPTDIIGRLARLPTGFGIYKYSGVCEAIITSDGLERLIALLDSPNNLLHGTAAVTIDRLVRDSPEGQRRLLKQCRAHIQYLDILRKFISGPSVLRTRVDELYTSIHPEPAYLPPIGMTKTPY